MVVGGSSAMVYADVGNAFTTALRTFLFNFCFSNISTEVDFFRVSPTPTSSWSFLDHIFPMPRFIGTVRFALLVSGILFSFGLSYYFGLRHGQSRTFQRDLVLVNAPKSGRVQADFERQDAMILGFNELIEHHPETLVQIVSAIQSRIQIIGLVKTEEQRDRVNELLQSRGIAPDGISYFVWPAEIMWVRDYSPIFVVNGGVTMVDFDYRPENGENTDFENLFPVAFAARFNFPYTHSRLTLEGGNFVTNGEGICLSTTTMAAQNSSKRQLSLEEVAGKLGEYFRMNRWVYLESLVGDQVSHVDTFATFVSPDQVVVGAYDAEQSPENALILDKNAEILSQVSTPRGPLKVTRIRRPPNIDGRFHTYTNVVFANGVLLVPQYPTVSPELDREAIRAYQALLPNWEIIGIDATQLIRKRGALHCVCAGVPRMPKNAQ